MSTDCDDVSALRIQVAKTTAFVRGVIAVGTVLFASIQYFALRELQGIDQRTERIGKVEQQVAILEVKTDFLVERVKSFSESTTFNRKGQSHR